MTLTPIQRKAELAKASTLREQSLDEACRSCGASWVHIRECLAENRVPSYRHASAIAEYCGISIEEFWGSHVAPALAS